MCLNTELIAHEYSSQTATTPKHEIKVTDDVNSQDTNLQVKSIPETTHTCQSKIYCLRDSNSFSQIAVGQAERYHKIPEIKIIFLALYERKLSKKGLIKRQNRA